MKQRITVEQLQELTPEQQGRLREWWKPVAGDYFMNTYQHPLNRVLSDVSGRIQGRFIDTQNNVWAKDEILPLLSIGQCIELGYYCGKRDTITIPMRGPQESPKTFYWEQGEDIELIDAIWESVKRVL